MSINFKHKQTNNNDIDYIRYNNLILLTKSIVYIEENTRCTFDSLIPDIFYTIHFTEELCNVKNIHLKIILKNIS